MFGLGVVVVVVLVLVVVVVRTVVEIGTRVVAGEAIDDGLGFGIDRLEQHKVNGACMKTDIRQLTKTINLVGNMLSKR